MPYRTTPFVIGSYYHICNRGLKKQKIFSDTHDYNQFLNAMRYYQYGEPKPKFSVLKKLQLDTFYKNPKITEIICYCLMPNHFHLMVREIVTGGTQEFVRKLSTSYARYYNTRHNQTGPLLQGRFFVTTPATQEELLHMNRYIHLNPYAAYLTDVGESYPYSSYPTYLNLSDDRICNPTPILETFSSIDVYKEFVNDQADYSRSLEEIKHLLAEEP